MSEEDRPVEGGRGRTERGRFSTCGLRTRGRFAGAGMWSTSWSSRLLPALEASRVRFLVAEAICGFMRCSSSISAVMEPTVRRALPRREKQAALAESAPSAMGRALNLKGSVGGIDIWPVSG